MGKANRTHQVPPVIENLGDGSFYYNFNVVKSTIEEEGEQPEGTQYDYDQVRCRYPEKIEIIQGSVNREGYDHQVNLEENE